MIQKNRVNRDNISICICILEPAASNLPSIRQLAREQRISVITVQGAYEILEREGLISLKATSV